MFKVQSPEDQVKFCLPLNRDTEQLFYNTRLIIDAAVLTEPRCWLVSKINRSVSKGVVIYTTTQDIFNQFTDQVFYKENGDVDYWVADWNKSVITPEDGIPSTDASSIFATITSKITYSGAVNQIKVGGSKTFTVAFYEEDEAVEHDPGEWSITLGGEEITDQAEITYPAPDKVRVKLGKDDSMIGKILSIVNTTSDGVVSQADVEVIPL